MRFQINVLKKKLADNEENHDKIFNKETIGLEEKIRLKIQEYKAKLSDETLKHT